MGELGRFHGFGVQRDQQVLKLVQPGPGLADLGSGVLRVGVGPAEQH